MDWNESPGKSKKRGGRLPSMVKTRNGRVGPSEDYFLPLEGREEADVRHEKTLRRRKRRREKK